MQRYEELLWLLLLFTFENNDWSLTGKNKQNLNFSNFSNQELGIWCPLVENFWELTPNKQSENLYIFILARQSSAQYSRLFEELPRNNHLF